MARANRISGCVSTISAQSPYMASNGEKKRRAADLHARRTAMSYLACRSPYRLERVGERLVFPQMDVDAGVLGCGVEQVLD